MNLKTILLAIITAVLAATGTHAQIDSIPGAVLLPRQSDLSLEMDYLLGRKIPARWMLYVGREVESSTEDRFLWLVLFKNVTNIGFFYKITPDIALGTSISSAEGGIHVKLYQRWFFEMRKRIREDRGANNFSGQYIGLSEEVVTFLGPYFSFKNNFSPRFQLRYGIQQRFHQHILMDFSVGLSSNTSLLSNKREHTFFSITPSFNLSGALFPYAAQKGARQNLRPRFHEQQRMFKTDLLELFRKYWYNNPSGAYRFDIRAIFPYVAFEQKWGQLPVSTELGLRGSFMKTHMTSNRDKFTDNIFQSIYSFETRWFYTQASKIAAGKAGNNLSGPFLAFHHHYQQGRIAEISFDSPSQTRIQYHRTFLILGYQQRFFKWGFAQLKLGAGREAHHIFREEGYSKYVNRQVYSEVRAGFAF